MQEVRTGALSVMAKTEDPAWVNRRLSELDGNLFCELQLTFEDEQVWCVVEDTGEARGVDRYVTVLEWRDGAGKPIPYLSEGIVDEMRRRAREGYVDNPMQARAIAERRNRERRERLERESYEAYHEIAKDFEDHRKIGHFAIVPRSTQLRMTRDRVRREQAEQMRTVASALEIARELQRRSARATLTGR